MRMYSLCCWFQRRRVGLNPNHESDLSRGVKGSFLPKLLPFHWAISILHPGAFHCDRHLKERLHLPAGCRRNFEIHQERWHLWPGWNPLLKPSEKIFSLLDWRDLVPVGHMWRLIPLLTWHCGKINLHKWHTILSHQLVFNNFAPNTLSLPSL